MTDDLFSAIMTATDAVRETSENISRVNDRLEARGRLIQPIKKPAQPFTVAGIRPVFTFPAFGSTAKQQSVSI
jgi:hypothetical protein